MQFDRFDCAQHVSCPQDLPTQLHDGIHSVFEDTQPVAVDTQPVLAGLEAYRVSNAEPTTKLSPASGVQLSPRMHSHAEHIARLLANIKDSEEEGSTVC
jgi:U3 small nucleolar ribonucleoprotein component